MLNKTLKRAGILIMFGTAFSVSGLAQDDVYVNPGFKMGYAFGQEGGFIFGLEVSVTRWPQSGGPFTGVFISLEKMKKTTIVHFGIEASELVGLSLGPSLVSSEKGRKWGVGATMFGGILALPYIRLTYLDSQSTVAELGSFFKLPIALHQRKYSLGG